MELAGFLIQTLVAGLIIGALARVVVPGPTPMSVGSTILFGIAGAFVGGAIAGLIGGGAVLITVFQIIAAAVLIQVIARFRRTPAA